MQIKQWTWVTGPRNVDLMWQNTTSKHFHWAIVAKAQCEALCSHEVAIETAMLQDIKSNQDLNMLADFMHMGYVKVNHLYLWQEYLTLIRNQAQTYTVPHRLTQPIPRAHQIW